MQPVLVLRSSGRWRAWPRTSGSKAWVSSPSSGLGKTARATGRGGPTLLWGRFEIRLTTLFNEGALFGIGQGFSWLFAALSILAVAGIVYWLFVRGEARSWWLTVTLGLILPAPWEIFTIDCISTAGQRRTEIRSTACVTFWTARSRESKSNGLARPR